MVVRYLWPALLWSIFLLVLSLIPGRELPAVEIFQVDKVVHFFFFSVLMVLTAFGLYKIKMTSPAKKVFNEVKVSCIYSLSLGTGIEILQRFVPGRSFSWADMLANSIGVVIGYLMFILLRRRLAKSTS